MQFKRKAELSSAIAIVLTLTLLTSIVFLNQFRGITGNLALGLNDTHSNSSIIELNESEEKTHLNLDNNAKLKTNITEETITKFKKIKEEVQQEVKSKRRARVLVILKKPSKPLFETTKLNLEKIKKDVKKTQNKVLDNLNSENNIPLIQGKVVAEIKGPDFELTKKYETASAISGYVTEEGLKQLELDPNVEQVILDPLLKVNIEESIPQINADQVWSAGLNGTGETVCIIDTGIDSNHPEFIGKTIIEHCFCYTTDYGSGGCCPNAQVEDTSALDDDGHGTHVAGIVAADNLLKGVAPNSDLVVVKVCDNNGDCSGSDILAGIDWCVTNKEIYDISVISMSLGDALEYEDATCPNYFEGVLQTAYEQGIFIVAASGNEGYTNGINYPACSSYVTSVGGVTKSDNLASYTNTGSNLDLLAPGSDIESTYLNNGYAYMSGTSMATPHVAGAAALLIQQDSSLTPAQIKSKLINSEILINGYPRIDVLSAVIDQCNAGDKFCKPLVVLTSPFNNTLYSVSNTLILNYNATSKSDIANCSLILNGQINTTNSSITTIENNFILELDNGQYNWSVNCTEGSAFANEGHSTTFNLNILVCTDNDGDGFNQSALGCGITDCNDTNSSIYPGATETCNNVDDDCNNIIDEGLTQPTTCGFGICTGNTGIEICDAGAGVNDTCNSTFNSAVENTLYLCVDNLDNDCDNLTDEDDLDCNISQPLSQILNPINRSYIDRLQIPFNISGNTSDNSIVNVTLNITGPQNSIILTSGIINWSYLWTPTIDGTYYLSSIATDINGTKEIAIETIEVDISTTSIVNNSNITNSSKINSTIVDSIIMTNTFLLDAIINDSSLSQVNATNSNITTSVVQLSKFLNSTIIDSSGSGWDVNPSTTINTVCSVGPCIVHNSTVIDSTLTIATIENSDLNTTTITSSTINTSTITESIVTNTLMDNSTITDIQSNLAGQTGLRDMTVQDANITSNNIYIGNITYNGFSYLISTNLPSPWTLINIYAQCGNNICENLASQCGTTDNYPECNRDCGVCSSSSTSSSSGSSSSGGGDKTIEVKSISCREEWDCTKWEGCQSDGTEIRFCWDLNSCDNLYTEGIIGIINTSQKPLEIKHCNFTGCSNGILDWNETRIDCGGPICQPCEEVGQSFVFERTRWERTLDTVSGFFFLTIMFVKNNALILIIILSFILVVSSSIKVYISSTSKGKNHKRKH